MEDRNTATATQAAAGRAQAGISHALTTCHDELGLPISRAVKSALAALEVLRVRSKELSAERGQLARDRLGAPRDFRAANLLAAYEAAKKGETDFAIGTDPAAAIDERTAAINVQLLAIKDATQLGNAEVMKELSTNGTFEKLQAAWAEVFTFEPGPETTYSETGSNAVKAQVLRNQGQALALAIQSYLAADITDGERRQLKQDWRKSDATEMPTLAALREVTRSRGASTPAALDAIKRAEQKALDQAKNISDAAASAAARNIGGKGTDEDEAGPVAKGKTAKKTKASVPA